MGDAIYFEYDYNTDTSESTLDDHRHISFGPYVSGMSPKKFSRLGDVDIVISGSGFVSEMETRVHFESGSQSEAYHFHW